MTAKERANKLFKEFFNMGMTNGRAQKAVIKHCDEIIALINTLNKPEYTAFVCLDTHTVEAPEYDTHAHGYDLIRYYKQVKKEAKNIL